MCVLISMQNLGEAFLVLRAN